MIAIAAVLCAATSPPRYSYPRSYPAWKITDSTLRVTECGELSAWVSKSGKTGVGVTVRVAPRGAAACDVRVVEAAMVVGGQRVDAAGLPEPGDHVYIPFAFDNEASWNRGERTGTLNLRFEPGPALRLAIEHQRGAPHDKIDRYKPQPAPQRPPLQRTQ